MDEAKDLAEAADRSWQVAQSADFDAMSRLPDQAVRDRAKAGTMAQHAGLLVFAQFDDNLRELARIHRWLGDFHAQPEGYQSLDEIASRRKQARPWSAPWAQNYVPGWCHRLKARLSTNSANKKLAQALHTLLQGGDEARAERRLV